MSPAFLFVFTKAVIILSLVVAGILNHSYIHGMKWFYLFLCQLSECSGYIISSTQILFLENK